MAWGKVDATQRNHQKKKRTSVSHTMTLGKLFDCHSLAHFLFHFAFWDVLHQKNNNNKIKTKLRTSCWWVLQVHHSEFCRLLGVSQTKAKILSCHSFIHMSHSVETFWAKFDLFRWWCCKQVAGGRMSHHRHTCTTTQPHFAQAACRIHEWTGRWFPQLYSQLFNSFLWWDWLCMFKKKPTTPFS